MEWKHQQCHLSVVREISARPSRIGSPLCAVVSLSRLDRHRVPHAVDVEAYAFAFVSSYLPLSCITMASRLSSREDYADLLDKYDTWLFDCDGVLWSGDKTIDGAIEVLQLLRHHSV